MHTKFSVLLSVYKSEDAKNLNIALESIWDNQLLKPDEIVLVIDGPLTVELDSVIKAWSERSLVPLNIIRLAKNLGLPVALNIGLKHCSHELVARMDSDDISTPARFQKQISHMEANPDVSISGAWIREFDSHPNDLTNIRKVPVEYEKIRIFAKKRCPLNHMSVIYKKTAIIEAGGYSDLSNSQDYHLWGRMLASGYKIDNMPDILIYARTNSSFQNRRGGWKFIKIEYKIFSDFYKIGFLTWFEAILAFSSRVFVRLIPSFLRTYIYNKFFRSN